MTETPAPIPAATLVIFRDGILRDTAKHLPEILMVERAKTMTFAGGALVFPGGRVEASDHGLAAQLGHAGDDGAGRIAAIRETIEEAGLAIGIDPLPDAATIAAMRAALAEGATLGALLDRFGLRLAPDALTPFARWLPDHPTTRIFDTRFYLARLADGAGAAQVDRTENSRLAWMTARDVLAAADAGDVTVIYPTRRNLERLAQFASHDAARADALGHPVRTITPFVTRRADGDWLCIPEGLGYPVTGEPMARVRRA
jgi:8-oxo-dGTP pyrophosphatase MutT (NUDIX family)